MKISENCLNLIKKWEGFYSEAYRCPANVPTIGYGTIRYPNGQKVNIGDIISEPVAEACLHHECAECERGVTEAVKVDINQNQFDALVSFTYNLGIGAFQRSTLLKKINAGKFDEAAKEFDRWVHITDKKTGVKTRLEGLVNRRKDERLLFERIGDEKSPIEIEESPQESVTWLEGFRDNDDTVIVAWNGGQVVEMLTLESNSKRDLIYLLQQYPNANKFCVAPSSKKIPKGERIPVAGREKDIEKVNNPPTLEASLLIRGMNDADMGGNDIKELQKRLYDLGYYNGNIDGDFSKVTDIAVRDFQEDYFGAAEADGKVGPLTWKKLWGEAQKPKSTVNNNSTIPGRNYLKLTKTNRKDIHGCYVLDMAYYKDGTLKDSLEVCSGLPKFQVFRTGVESESGSFQPLPEGQWYINDIRWVEKDNYHAPSMTDGVGPVTVRLDYKGPGSTSRKHIEIHIDNNRKAYPGTAGCIGVYNIADYKKFVSWLRETDPRDLYVDWNLGTCPNPDKDVLLQASD